MGAPSAFLALMRTPGQGRVGPHRSPRPMPAGLSRPDRAFTLLELLAVIAIIAILTGIVIGVGRRATESGKIARAKAELAALSVALESYKRQYGDYPRTSDEATLLQSLIGKLSPTGAALSSIGRTHIEAARFAVALESAPDTTVDPFTYTAATLRDPWGQSYHYAYNTRANGWQSPSFLLVSAGPDEKLTLPLPGTGYITSNYEQILDADQKPVNADNLYANRN